MANKRVHLFYPLTLTLRLLVLYPCYMYVYSTGKTPEEIRKTFNIKNDFTPEEEEQVSMGNTCTCTCRSTVTLCAIRMSSGMVDFKSF